MELITDEEIKESEKILLLEGSSFSDYDKEFRGERIDIIRNFETIDIKACPGSGKTTVLLAKLLILANRLPFDDQRGICVLTHTNVAIDEIKEKLGSKSDVLFNYPNHFGTFQSFVDKFLAIPAYSYFNKKHIKIIDEEYYRNIIIKYIPNNLQSNPFLYKKRDWKNQLADWRFSLNDKNDLVKYINGDNVFKSSNKTYEQVLEYKQKILNEYGILNFDDAYCLAFWYLNQFPKLKNYFSSRFKYIFIDEMQDTYKHQNDIIIKLIDKEKVTLQRYGDPYQGIFDGKNETELTWEIKNSLVITKSKRFGENIACPLKTICIKKNDSLKGDENILSLKPIIILFDDNSKELVIDKFSDIIFNNKIHKITNKPFKAIGWVQEHDNKISIKSYYPNYSKIINRKIRTFLNLRSYLTGAKILKSQKVKEYKDLLINFFIKILDEAGIKTLSGHYYNIKSFIEFIKRFDEKKYFEFMIKISKWIKYIKIDINIELILSDIQVYIFNDYSKIWNQLDLNSIQDLINGTEIIINDKEIKEKNSFKKTYNNETIEIQIGTIHSVKGETHGATLYLETYFHEYDSDRIKDFICGNYNCDKVKGRIKDNLKMAYVGMSRPIHLLCFAVHKDRIGCLTCDKKSMCNWEINDELVSK